MFSKTTRPATPGQQLSLFEVFLSIAPRQQGTQPGDNPDLTGLSQILPFFQLLNETTPSGELTRIRANLAAIQQCRAIQDAGRAATSKEWQELSQFSGWGALAGLWDETAHAIESVADMNAEQHRWHNRYKTLRQQADAVMNADECERASSSSLSAFYTQSALITPIWELLQKIGFTGGHILDPGAGSGNFIGAMPAKLRAASRITAVEKDPLSAAILSQLYPDVITHASGLENAPLLNESFDLIVGNIPFGDFKVFDAAEREWSKHPIHNYFIGKASRLAAPGGLVCLITSMGTLDQSSKAFRLQLDAARMELLGAIRLPSCTFEKSAGTEVTTDVLLFQKRPEGTARTGLAQSFVNTATLRTDEPPASEDEQIDGVGIMPSIEVNQYFTEHPDMMLGEMNFASAVGKGGLYRGDRQTLFLENSSELFPRLNTAVDVLSQQLPDVARRFGTDARNAGPDRATHEQHPQLAETIKIHGRLWNKQSIYRSYLKLKNLFFDLLKAEQSQPDAVCTPIRDELRAEYTFFTGCYGRLSSNRALNWIEDIDGQFLSVQALEITKPGPDGKPLTTESTILHERVFGAENLVTRVDGIEDGLHLSLFNRGRIDLTYISQLTGKAAGQVSHYLLSKALVFADPQQPGHLIEAGAYLSGNVREKLDQLQNRLIDEPELQVNADALIAVLPMSRPLSLISFQLGANWLPLDCLTDWIQTVLAIRVKLTYSEKKAAYTVQNLTGYSAVNQAQGTRERSGLELIEAALNQRSIVIVKTVWVEGSKREVKDIEAMSNAIQQQESLQERFVEWASEQYGPAIETAFNDRFCAEVARKYPLPNRSHYPGASADITLRDHQFSAVERAKEDNGMLAHGVGTGKTWVMITAAMELIRLGKISKAMMAVQNSTVADFSNAWRALYPAAIIYQPTKADLQASNRKRFLQRIATNRFDGIVIPQSFLKLIPDDAAVEEELIRAELGRIDIDDNEDDQSAEAVGARRSGKQRIKAVNKLKAKIEARRYEQASRKTDQMLNFSQLGIDALFLDECFPYQTPILTNEGWLGIGDIVTQKRKVNVLSFRKEKGIFEWKPVVNWLEKPLKKRLVTITHSQGSVVCTEDHRIWTLEDGYVKAGQLNKNHHAYFTPVRMVPHQPGETQQKSVLQPELFNGVQTHPAGAGRTNRLACTASTPQRLPAQGDPAKQTNRPDAPLQMVPAGSGQIQAKKILQQNLLSGLPECAGQGAGNVSGAVSTHEKGSCSRVQSSGPFRADAGKQPDEQPGIRSQNGSIAQRTHLLSEGRKWAANEATEAVMPGVGTTGRKHGMGNPDSTREGQISFTAQPLQGRYRHSSNSVGHRGGRRITQVEEVEVSRQTQNGNIGCVRVEGVTVHERASESGTGFTDSESDRVYDLTVAENHNYFAGGILVSNCHKYKRMGFYTSRYQIKGIDTAGSQDAFQAMVKCRTILNKSGKVWLATGTPISNTMAEAWTMLRFTDSDRLEKLGLSTFDQFCGTFCKVVPVFELTTSGNFKTVERLAQFVNVAQLSAIYRQSVDVVMNDEVREFQSGELLPTLKLQPAERPETQPGEQPEAEPRPAPGYTRTLLTQTEGVKTELAEIRATLRWFENLSGGDKRKHCHIPLVMYGRAKKATLDIRLLDPSAPDEEGNKTSAASREIFRIYTETSDVNGTQLVFCDVFRSSASVGSDEDEAGGVTPQFNLFDEITRKLVAMGIPADQIAQVPADKNKREPIFEKLRAGIIRVALGSSERMGIGVNVQERLAAVHHLDAPNRPTDFEQRNGRLIRQGNLFAAWKRAVEIVTYGVEKTLDATSYGRLAIKQKFINQVLRGGSELETMTDVGDDDEFSAMNFEQMMATLSGSQTALVYTAKNHELTRLGQQKKAWQRGLMNAQTITEQARQRVSILTGLIPRLGMEAEVVNAKFAACPVEGECQIEGDLIKTLAFDGVSYSDRKEWGQPLERYLARVKSAARRHHSTSSAALLTINGLDLALSGELTGYEDHSNRAIYSVNYSWGANLKGQINNGFSLTTSLRAAVNRTLKATDIAKEQLTRARQQIEAFDQTLNQPFKKQAQLDHLTALVAGLKRVLESEAQQQQTDQPAIGVEETFLEE